MSGQGVWTPLPPPPKLIAYNRTILAAPLDDFRRLARRTPLGSHLLLFVLQIPTDEGFSLAVGIDHPFPAGVNSAAISVFVFGLYLLFMGLGLMIAPDFTLKPFGFPHPMDFWPRVVGVLVLCLATYYISAARAGLTAFFRWTVAVRVGVCVICGALVLLRIAPAPLCLLGLIDLAAALWTAWALRR